MGSAERGLAARRELGWLCGQGIGWAALADEASAVISRVVPYERFCFHRVDPETLLLTGSMARNLGPPSSYRQVIQNEYEQDDVNKWSSLATAAVPVASIVDATAGPARAQHPFPGHPAAAGALVGGAGGVRLRSTVLGVRRYLPQRRRA